MPLEPYQYRPVTPNSTTPSPEIAQSGHSRNESGSSTWSSPESNITRATTPNHSPRYGAPLLPKIRTRDQGLEPELHASTRRRRAQSHDCDTSAVAPSRPGYQRSTTSPPECSADPTPVSAISTAESWANSTIDSPVTFSASYARRNLGHTRSTSTSAIEAVALRRACPPTYRSLPVYVTHQSPQYTPAVIAGLEDFVPTPLAPPAHPLYRELTPELIVETGEEPTTTIGEYLTGSNPAINLVPENARGYGNGAATHCWWDVRNLRPWDVFKIDTITSIAVLKGLLNVDVNAVALPTPSLYPSSHQPHNLSALQETIKRFHVAKVNAALRTTQGADRHITIQTTLTAQDGPHFISNYANDTSKTMAGNGRARVVGLVKPYELWNSGKRHEKGQKQVEYLRGLAHLQRLMREHNCRYGFIITEIELVCVRMGTAEGAPYFGLLELSRPIEMKAQTGLTACMALWFLHMLTSEVPLPGQCGWKIDVGPPAAWTRSRVLEEGRDEWMIKVQQNEERAARTLRGWAWPEDAIHRRKEGVVVGRKG